MDHHLVNGRPGNPALIAKYQRHFRGFDEKIISMYARGMSVREIAGHVRELYGVEVSPDRISAVTDAVLDELAAWQARPLEALYPLIFFDALRLAEGLSAEQLGHRRSRRPDGLSLPARFHLEDRGGCAGAQDRGARPHASRCAFCGLQRGHADDAG